MTFGERLRELRKAKGMTQRGLAQKTGISFTYVSKLESGVMSPPRQKTILALAKALGANDANTDELFGLARKMPPDLLERVDAQVIRILRSLEHGKETRTHELARLRRRIAELRASEARDIWLKQPPGRQEDTFRALVENSPYGIVILDSELELIYENPSVTRILGYEPGESAATDSLGLIHPDDISKLAHGFTKLAQTPGRIDRGQARVRHKDGTWRVIDAVGINLLHKPAVKGILLTIREIRRRFQDQGALAEAAAASAMAKQYGLTKSEHRILTLIAEGHSNPQIAEQLVVSPSTVRFHVSNILRKLGATSRTEAATIGVRRRLVN